MNPILPLGILGLGAVALLASKKSGASPAPVPTLPATSAPPSAPSQTVSTGGHSWKLVPLADGSVDVFAPAGSWGPHGELRVLRFKGPSGSRILVGAAEGVPKTILDAAMKDLGVKPPTGPTVMTPAGKPPMPASLQQEMIAVMMALGVDSTGVVRGPVTPDAVRRATELSSRLEQAGYPEAAATLRSYAQAGAKLLPPPTVPPPIVPGVPAELAAQIARALELERDPAKLEALKIALQSLPQSGERDLLIGALDALIVQVRTAQAIATAATEIEQMTTAAPTPSKPAPKPAATAPGKPRVLMLTKPNMSGADVKAWQLVLRAAGYSNVEADGFFGPATEAATKDWQKKRNLTADGKVGPATLAKVATAPTAPVTVPTAPSPRPDPTPKSPVEVAAEALVTHLLALQQKHGAKGSKGREDKTLVKRFQSAAGLSADGFTGPGTLVTAARAGQGKLPKVMYWPKTATRAGGALTKYRADLEAVAQKASSAGLPTLAASIRSSATAEDGSGGLP